MNPELFINAQAKLALKELYGAEVEERLIQTQATRKEFEGDITLVTFPLLKTSHKGPEQTAEEIGRWLKERCPEVESFNVVKGFLNIKFSLGYWSNIFRSISAAEDFGTLPPTGKRVMIEFSSPNTNKPLHLGHIRNNLLGWSVSKLL